MFSKYNFRRFDYFLIIIVLLLSVAGIVAIGSATGINVPGASADVRNKQIIGLVTGCVLMLIVAFFDYHWIGKLTIPLYIVNLALLGAVLVAGVSRNNATRWLMIGTFQLQPSEFAKIFMVLILAKYFDALRKHVNKPPTILVGIIITAIPVLLIFKQPDLSTSMIMFLIFAFIIFVAGLSWWYILGAAAIGIPVAIWGFQYIQSPEQKLLEGYQVNRILSLIDPTKVSADLLRQTNNSIQAIGSGKLFGKGLYLGKVNQYDYLPEPQTDFIFSIIGEEFGFFGCFIVLLLIFLLIARIIWIGKDTVDLYGKLIITGYAAVLMYHTFVNVGVTTGIVPNTGVPLPFISAGISSLWNNLIGIGIILNISMQRKQPGNAPPVSGVNSRTRRRGTTT